MDSSGKVNFKTNRTFEVPQGYGDNRIILMVRDPWAIFAYWEIDKDGEESIRHQISEAGETALKSILRVYDVNDTDKKRSPCIAYDFELRDWANNWYIHTESPGKEWMAEIGILCASGEFYRLVRSNTVKTPRCSMSDMSSGDYSDMFGSANLFNKRK